MPNTRAAHRALLTALRNRECVVVESPYRGDEAAQREPGGVYARAEYARAAIADSLARGEAPFASHLFYTQFLDDTHDASRRTGLMCGWAWLTRASLVAVYLDLGWSPGMREGVSLARSLKLRVEERSVPGWVAPTPAPAQNWLPMHEDLMPLDPPVQPTQTDKILRAAGVLPPDATLLPPLYQEPRDPRDDEVNR
jgi:hypothetical protein